MAIETYELRIRGIQRQQSVESILHFTGSGLTANATFENADLLCGGWDTHLVSPWLDLCSDGYNLMDVRARRVSSKPSAEAFRSYPFGSWAGTITGPSSGTQLRQSIFLVPTLGTKSGGRIFLPPLPASEAVGNILQTPMVAAISAFMTLYLAGFTTSGVTWQPVIWSRKLGTASVVVSYNTSLVFGYQKRSRAVLSR